MDITATRLWASPSTLHLRCVVTFKTREAVQFLDLHVPLEMLPKELQGYLELTADLARDPQPGDSLF